MSGTDYPDWRVGGGGNATINSVVLPLVINSGVLSVNNSTTTTSGVVIINDLYTSIPSHTDATTSFFVTQAIAAAIVSGKSFRGGYDASSGAYPSTGGSLPGGEIGAGDYWVITVAGTVGSILVLVGDTLTALIQDPGQISTNWFINAAGVSSVFGRFGNIVAVSGDYNISQITNGLSNVLPSANIFVGNGSGIATGVSLSGDIGISNTGLTTLATVNATVGSFGSSTSIPSFTVNGKGLITAASSSVVIAPAGTLTGTTLASNVVSSSLTSVGTLITGIWNATAIDLTNYASGVLQAAQFPALTGDVTNTVGSLVTAISNTTVTGKLLTGYVAGTNTPIVATDSILTAFQNLQAQVSGTSGAAITSLTGDATATGPGASALTLATVNSNVGSFGSSTSIPSFTVNGKGLLTAAGSSVVIAPSGTLTGTTLASNVVSSSLTSVGILTSGDTGATQVVDPTTTTSAALNLALSNILAASGVTSVSVVSANGLAGTVATASTTPAITLSTTVTGLVKGDGTALSAAVSGTDYSAGTSALGTGILKSTTGTGALTIAVAADFPILNQSTTGNATTATTSTNLAETTVNSIPYQSASATTGYVAPINNAVLATNGSGVPSLVTTLPAINGGSLTGLTGTLNSSVNSMTVAVNGGTASSPVNIINSNALGLTGVTLTSIINGVVSNTVSVQPLISSPTANNIVYVNGSGQVIDSGISVETTLTNTNLTLPTSQAVTTAINNAVLNGVSFRGGYNASTNLFPATGGSGTAGAIRAGDYWYITVQGTLGSTVVYPNDSVTALINVPGQTSSNWLIDQTTIVSVFGRTGAVVATTGDYTIAQITNGLTKVLTSAFLLVGNSINVASGVALSGDATINNTGVLTLATVNANVGSFGSSTAIPSITVNGKGLLTAASTNAVIAPAGTLSGTTLNSTVVTSSLTSVGTIATGTWQAGIIGTSYGGLGVNASTTNATVYGFNVQNSLNINGSVALQSSAYPGIFPSFAFISIASQNLLYFGLTKNVAFSNYGYVKNNQSNITGPANLAFSFTLGIGIFYVEANLYAADGSTGWAKFQITNGSGTLIGSSNKKGFVQTTGAAGWASSWTVSNPATSIITVTSGTTQVFINIYEIASGQYIVLDSPSGPTGSFVKVTQIG
jgi:hypothetical protein